MRHVTDGLLRERLTHPGYELFILGLSILSLGNLVVLLLAPDREVDSVVWIVDTLLCIVFMLDFAWRLWSAPDRGKYMRLGWADFLGSLPAPGLRLFRLVRITISVRVIQEAGGRRIIRQLVRERAETAIFLVFFVAITVLEFASILVLVAERDWPGHNIKTGGESLWWAWVSVTAVGYGDFYPVSPWGRIIASVLLGVGIGLVTTITGFLATKLLPQRDQAPRAEEQLLQASELVEGGVRPPGPDGA
jgi:voltage-gated potassium channel